MSYTGYSDSLGYRFPSVLSGVTAYALSARAFSNSEQVSNALQSNHFVQINGPHLTWAIIIVMNYNWLVFCCFMIYDPGIADGCEHLFPLLCGPFYWVVVQTPPLPLTGERYGKIDLKYCKGGHCQSLLCPQGVLTFPSSLINLDQLT